MGAVLAGRELSITRGGKVAQPRRRTKMIVMIETKMTIIVLMMIDKDDGHAHGGAADHEDSRPDFRPPPF